MRLFAFESGFNGNENKEDDLNESLKHRRRYEFVNRRHIDRRKTMIKTFRAHAQILKLRYNIRKEMRLRLEMVCSDEELLPRIIEEEKYFWREHSEDIELLFELGFSEEKVISVLLDCMFEEEG